MNIIKQNEHIYKTITLRKFFIKKKFKNIWDRDVYVIRNPSDFQIINLAIKDFIADREFNDKEKNIILCDLQRIADKILVIDRYTTINVTKEEFDEYLTEFIKYIDKEINLKQKLKKHKAMLKNGLLFSNRIKK